MTCDKYNANGVAIYLVFFTDMCASRRIERGVVIIAQQRYDVVLKHAYYASNKQAGEPVPM